MREKIIRYIWRSRVLFPTILLLVLFGLVHSMEKKTGKERALLRTFVNYFEDVLFVSLWAKPPFQSSHNFSFFNQTMLPELPRLKL